MLKRVIGKFKKFFSRSSDFQELIDKGMKVGENCALFSTTTIDHLWPWLISFGNNVTVSTNVTILAHDASPNVVGMGTKLGRVVIGDYVFIGTGCTILCDTIIGDHVIIGAGSVVSGNIESNSVYCGVPAKKLCSIEEYKKKMSVLRQERPDLSIIHKWDKWDTASKEDKDKMINLLNDGCGFV